MPIVNSMNNSVQTQPLPIIRCILLAALVLFYSGQNACAHEKHPVQKEQMNHRTQANQVQLRVPDLKLTNQDGKQGHLVSEFIGDKLVAFTFVYTTCTTICPVIDGIFKNLQNRIGDDLGREFNLLTLTIDSAVDIPARLKEHTQKLGVLPGWNYLTGDKDTVKQLLKALEVYTPDIANHPPVIFVVDGRNGTWLRLNGFSSPALIEKTLRQQLVAR